MSARHDIPSPLRAANGGAANPDVIAGGIWADQHHVAEAPFGFGHDRRLESETTPSNTIVAHAALVAKAERLYRERTRRAAAFSRDQDLFGEPAWDILLDLYVCETAGRQVTMTDACIASRAPATTGLRWIATLTDRGLIERHADERDGRRSLLKLTARGRTGLEACLSE